MAFVKDDSELTIDPRNNGPYFALWLSHWVDGDHPWFDWFKGRLNTKHPDRKTLGKALQIARHFGGGFKVMTVKVYERVEDLS